MSDPDFTKCNWEFKSYECGYKGNAKSCDKSFTSCIFYRRSHRFGGKPIVEKVKSLSFWKRLKLKNSRRILNSKQFFTKKNIISALLVIATFLTIVLTGGLIHGYYNLQKDVNMLKQHIEIERSLQKN